MRVCGIICEYDPFHNGHAYHMQYVRHQTRCDYIVCAMSGHFTQRGRPALLSKWARAEMALACGADAVFELPTIFAVRDAERFARGGVDLLDSLGVVTDLGFGSESGEMDALTRQATAQENSALVKAGLQRGETLARARAEAGKVSDLPSDIQKLKISSVTSLGQGAPNDILAVEYLRAIQKSGSAMNPVAVLRRGGAYHDPAFHALASATGIRNALQNGMDVQSAMPAAAWRVLSAAISRGEAQKPDGLDAALLYLLRTMTKEQLADIADVSEGLENRILKMARRTASRESLLEAVKCKRYTWARLSRILTQALLGISKDVVARNPAPAYARLLGFREDARPLLSAIRKNCKVPVVTRAAKAPDACGEMLSLDIAAGDIWSLGLLNPELRHGGRDLQTAPVIVR